MYTDFVIEWKWYHVLGIAKIDLSYTNSIVVFNLCFLLTTKKERAINKLSHLIAPEIGVMMLEK